MEINVVQLGQDKDTQWKCRYNWHKILRDNLQELIKHFRKEEKVMFKNTNTLYLSYSYSSLSLLLGSKGLFSYGKNEVKCIQKT